MSNYRDDTQETAVASDSAWLKVTTIAEDSAKADYDDAVTSGKDEWQAKKDELQDAVKKLEELAD